MNTVLDNIPEQTESLIDSLIKKARIRVDSPVVSDKLIDVQREIRARRKAFLGSSVRLGRIVYNRGILDYAAVSELADYLSARTVSFWDRPHEEGFWISRQFYELCLSAPRWMELDDIILLANAAAMERTCVFKTVMDELLPEESQARADVLASFVNDCLPLPNSFEDAVLGAISVFLGILRDPVSEEGDDNG